MAETQTVPSDVLTEGMECVAERPDCLLDVPFTYCPGCTHGTIHRLVAEAIDDLGVGDRAVILAPVGCAVWVYEFFDLDSIQAAHGRSPAVATGVKRVSPDNVVITYQGDGDLAGIGLAEVVHAASRGEDITCIFVNNAVFGMTQGQMAPTTLLGQWTTTSPLGRDASREGYPLNVCELLATTQGATYIERVTVIDAQSIRHAGRAIKKALQVQIDRKGFSLVEVLSICPTWWRKKPPDAIEWLREAMMEQYPLGVYKSPD